MTRTLTSESIPRLRMHSLLLGSKRMKTARQVAQWFGAMQAQDLASGKWSFGVRLPGATEREVDAAIERGEVLRTWPMRGTIHFVPSADARWMLQTTGAKALARVASRRASIGLDEKTANRAVDVLARALVGGQRLTRTEAIERLESNGIATDGQRAYHLLGYASQLGVTCIGPNFGKEQTFVLLDDWATQQLSLTRDEALATLALRYFRSHGPATQQDFMGWTGLSAAEARRGMQAVEKQLTSGSHDGRTFWMSKSLPDESESHRRRVQVLPGFDEYLLGIKDRSLAVPAVHKNKIVPGNNGMFMPTMVADGVVVGIWKRTLKKSLVEIRPRPFGRLGHAQRCAFEEAFEGYAKYLGTRASIGWS